MRSSRLCFLLAAALRRYALAIGMNALPLSSWRVQLLRACGVRVGKKCYIGFNVIADTNYPDRITIGDGATISHNCSLIAHTQSTASPRLSRLYNETGSIHIGDGAWIGMNTTILPNVDVGANCFIGAGSVVTKPTPANAMCAGNPCRFIKTLAA